MFDDDNAARHALHILTDDPAPPVTTTVDQVLRRGRRRVLVQRVGAAAGVMGVVAAIGVGAVLLRPGDQSGGVQVGDSNPPGLTTTVSPPQSETTRNKTSAPATPILDGSMWTPVNMPVGTDSGSGCVPMGPQPYDKDVALLPEGTVKAAFANAVGETVGKQPQAVTSQWEAHSPKHDGAPRGYVTAVVPMDDGNGEIQLEAGRFGGTPTEFADWSRTVYGNCVPPWRRVLDDGTVLQLFQVDDANAKAPMQHVQVYRPDGRLYIVTSAGFSEGDIIRHADGSGTVEGGRGELPIPSDALANIAERLLTNLG
jgi:hypothetical protein